jgi:hypothetical protein
MWKHCWVKRHKLLSPAHLKNGAAGAIFYIGTKCHAASCLAIDYSGDATVYADTGSTGA